MKYFNFGSFKIEIYYYIKKQQAKTDDLVGLLNNSVRSQDEEDRIEAQVFLRAKPQLLFAALFSLIACAPIRLGFVSMFDA